MDTTELLYKKVKSLLEANQTEQAKKVAKERDTKEQKNSSLHLRWADLLERLFLFDDMIIELNLAFRDNPNNLDTLKKLAEVCMDCGDMAKAAHYFTSLIKCEPNNTVHYKELGKVLEEAGAYAKALKVYRIGYEKTKDEDFKNLIKSLDFLKQEMSFEETIEKGDQIIPSKHHLVTFTTIFAGREGVYARQWSSPNGETGYTPVHEPFTIKAAENHILGNITVGVYPVRIDNTVNFIAFDLDIPKFIINKTITSESLWKKAIQNVHHTACDIVDIGASYEIPIYIEDSGFKGRHCWIFLETPIPAGVAKKFGNMLAGQLKSRPSDVSIEIFPKQESIKQENLGNLIKIPFGFHKKTGKRGVFINARGEVFPNQLEFMEKISKASRRSVYALIQRLSAQTQPKIQALSQKEETTPPWEKSESDKPAKITNERVIHGGEIEEYDPDRDIKLQYLFMKCPVLKAIVEKINMESTITSEESLVLIHAIGHLEHGPDAVNHFFKKCVNIDSSLFLKSRLKGNPVSCPKIRSRVPNITSKAACNCRFDPSNNMYPTPLIHVYTMPSETRALSLGLTVDSIQFRNLLEHYLKLRSQAHEIGMLLKKCEKELHDFFEQAGIEQVRTSMGDLKLKKENGTFSFSLEMNIEI